MLQLLTPLLSMLASNGLNLLSGAVQAKGKEFIEEKIGMKIPDNPSAEDLTKLRLAEMEHEETLLELSIEKQKVDIEAEKIYLADLDSARGLGKSLAVSESWLNRNIVPAMAIVAVIGGILMIVLSPESDVRMAGLSVVMMPLAYYFGTSQGSKQKQDQINRMLK